ncbi:MAG: hypothetical protein GY696_16100 [Gammaproteobacteria bacterium]|nr:hypothetical protein [Gammaproteobacteria bacterium]
MVKGKLLKIWTEGRQQKRQGEREVVVRIEDMVLISMYLQVFDGRNFVEREQARELVRTLAEWASNHDFLLSGGDFNAHVGCGEDRQDVNGKLGLRELIFGMV